MQDNLRNRIETLLYNSCRIFWYRAGQVCISSLYHDEKVYLGVGYEVEQIFVPWVAKTKKAITMHESVYISNYYIQKFGYIPMNVARKVSFLMCSTVCII